MEFEIPAISVLLAATSGAVLVSSLLSLWVLRRRTRRAFDEGRMRAEERSAAREQLLNERIAAYERERDRLETDVCELRDEARAAFETQHRLVADVAGLGAENAQLRAQLEQSRADVGALRPLLMEAERRAAELATRLDDAERAHAEREASFREASEMLRNEFRLLGHRIFEEHGQALAEDSRRGLDHVLAPFREQMADFKRRVDEVYRDESRDRASLLTEVRNLQQSSERINLEAANLTRALKGDKKLQGQWGELVLERVLEESGLRREHEYSVQMAFYTEQGDLRRPDVVVHLPDGKQVVIDAKVSLAAYEQAVAVEDDLQRARFIRQHIGDLKGQVKRLAEQEYDRLRGLQSLDFVLLFVPVEPAFTLAMEQEPGLFTEAFARRIVIVSPTTLLMALRIIHNLWRVDKRNRHAEEIARRAGALYDKLRSAMEDMDRLGTTLRTADGIYRGAMRKLATGRGNLVKQVERFRELGAPVRRPFSADLIEDAESERADWTSHLDEHLPLDPPDPLDSDDEADPSNGDHTVHPTPESVS